ncbi:MAG: hypothetical protein ACE5GN_07580, partial [Waddliaceae bacterium]
MADNNIKKISFFTPVAFQKKNKSFGRKLAEKCDSYLSLRGRKAEVLHSKDARHHEVKITEGKRNLWLTTAKIMSYFTLVVPFLALLGKLAFRSYYQFSVQPIKETPPNIQETAKKAEPVKATATWENAAAAQKDEYKKLEKKRLDVKRAERVPGEEKAEKKEELDPTQTQDTSGSEGSEEQTEETEKKETRSPPETAEISEDESSDSETESSESDPLELFDTEENSQKLEEIYKAVEDCHNQSKKYVVFKNDHFVVAKGKQKPAEKEEAFNKIVHIIRKSIEHNVDRFIVTETVEEKTSKEKKTSKKEVSIYALLEKLFSSKLG